MRLVAHDDIQCEIKHVCHVHENIHQTDGLNLATLRNKYSVFQ